MQAPMQESVNFCLGLESSNLEISSNRNSNSEIPNHGNLNSEIDNREYLNSTEIHGNSDTQLQVCLVNKRNSDAQNQGRKFKTLSMSEKLQLLKEIDKGNRKKKDIAHEFGIPASTLSTIYKNRDKLQEFADVVDSNRKRLKTAKYPEVEEETLKWLLTLKDMDVPVTPQLVREKAQNFAQLLGYKDFQGSVGWLEKFRSRYLYIVKSLQKKAACTSEDIRHKWTNGILPKIMKDYNENNIFCANETYLFHNCYLEKKLTNDYNYFSEEQINDWITLLMATNMSGKEKLPLLVISKLKNPPSLAHVKSNAVEYAFNSHACMEPDIFNAWLNKIDEKFALENRKIALVINESSNHKHIKDNLKAVKIFLIPSNLTADFQPMDHGIIKYFKYYYRRNMVLKFISFLNDSKKAKHSLSNCLRDVHMAWMNVTPSAINRSYRRAGFLKNTNIDIMDVTSSDVESIQEEWKKLQEMSLVPSDMTFESYVNIDENFTLLTQPNDDNVIGEFLLSDKNPESEPDSAVRHIPSFSETFFASENLRHFIESRENVPQTVFQALAHIDQFLLKEKSAHEMQIMELLKLKEDTA